MLCQLLVSKDKILNISLLVRHVEGDSYIWMERIFLFRQCVISRPGKLGKHKPPFNLVCTSACVLCHACPPRSGSWAQSDKTLLGLSSSIGSPCLCSVHAFSTGCSANKDLCRLHLRQTADWVSLFGSPPLHLSLNQSQQVVTLAACCHSQGAASAPVSETQEERDVCKRLVLRPRCHVSSAVKGGCVTMVR